MKGNRSIEPEQKKKQNVHEEVEEKEKWLSPRRSQPLNQKFKAVRSLP